MKCNWQLHPFYMPPSFSKAFERKETWKWHCAIQALLFVDFSCTLLRSLGHIKATHSSPFSSDFSYNVALGWGGKKWAGSLELKMTLVLRQILRLCSGVFLTADQERSFLELKRGPTYSRQSNSSYPRLSMWIEDAHSLLQCRLLINNWHWDQADPASRFCSVTNKLCDLRRSPGRL